VVRTLMILLKTPTFSNRCSLQAGQTNYTHSETSTPAALFLIDRNFSYHSKNGRTARELVAVLQSRQNRERGSIN
jgi:hypothetical protein